MNTWLTEIIKDSNERTFNDRELERIMTYYSGMPARLKAAEEVERTEPELAKALPAELTQKYPDRPLYAGRRFVPDLLEGLRPLVQAMLADDPRLFRKRWIDHLVQLLPSVEVDPAEVRDAYAFIAERLGKRIGARGRELLQPYWDDLFEALAAPAETELTLEATL